MATNPAVSVLQQYGVETTRGTAVTAAKQLTCSQIMIAKRRTNRFYRRPGQRFTSSGAKHWGWAEGALQGEASFEEMHVWLASMFYEPTPSNPGVGAYTRDYTVPNTPDDLYKTLTMQMGTSQAARQFLHVALRSLTINFEEGEGGGITLGGDAVGRFPDTGDTLDTITTVLPQKVMSGGDTKWYFDAIGGTMGTTQLLKVFSAEIRMPSNKTPRFVQEGTGTMADLVETAMEDATVVVRAENNSQTRAIEDAYDVDSKPQAKIRMNNDGDIIVGAIPYRFRTDMTVALEDVTEMNNVQETYGLEFTFKIQGLGLSLTNTQATL